MGRFGKGKKVKGGKRQDRRLTKRELEDQEIKQLEERIKEDYDVAGLKFFKDFPISQRTKKGLGSAGYVKPTRIQKATLKHALAGRDVLGAAKTGSGKTLAFLVPLVEKLNRERFSKNVGIGAVVISPTRELARQTYDTMVKVAAEHEMSCALFIGGNKGVQQEKMMAATRNIVICTPGRLVQHMDETPNFGFDNLQILVLDEADRLLDSGFRAELDRIISEMPPHRQTLLFSATQTAEVDELARLSLKNPVFVNVHKDQTATPARLKQCYVEVPLHEKINLLWSFIETHKKHKTIVFIASRNQVKLLYKIFCKRKPGISIFELRGRSSLDARRETLRKFSKAKAAVLLTTDVSARGLDIPNVNWVLQMDCPDSVDTYIHRVGRTARFGRSGNAMLFLLPSEQHMVKQLGERKVPVERREISARVVRSLADAMRREYATDPDMLLLGKKYFVSYVRSVFNMSDKDVFQLHALPLESFALSLGLPAAPNVRFNGKHISRLQAAQAPSGSAADGDGADHRSEEEGDSGDEDLGEGEAMPENDEEMAALAKGFDDDDAEEEKEEEEEEQEQEEQETAADEPQKPKKQLTRFQRLMARKNTNVLSEEFNKMHELGEQDDSLLVQRKTQTHEEINPSDKKQGALSRRKQRELSRQTVAAVRKRNLRHNEHYTFDEDGNPIRQGPKLVGLDMSDKAVAEQFSPDDDTIVQEKKQEMESLDEVDKELERQRIRERKLLKKQKERQRMLEEMEAKGLGGAPVLAGIGGDFEDAGEAYEEGGEDDQEGMGYDEDEDDEDDDDGVEDAPGAEEHDDAWLLDEDDDDLLPKKKAKQGALSAA